MPAKRSLQVDDKTPVKRLTTDQNYSPLTGTMPMSPKAKTQAGNYKTSGTAVNALEAEKPQTETERLDFLRSKLEGSLDVIMKMRQELEPLLPAGGNSELRSFLLLGPGDLKAELKRHKELTLQVNRNVNAAQMHEKSLQGTKQTGSSYEFLKNIFSG